MGNPRRDCEHCAAGRDLTGRKPARPRDVQPARCEAPPLFYWPNVNLAATSALKDMKNVDPKKGSGASIETGVLNLKLKPLSDIVL